MAGKKKPETCAFKKSVVTPCYVTDGDVALDGAGKCMGCGRTVAQITTPGTTPAPAVPATILDEEQAAEMKKIHKTAFNFHKEMEGNMAAGLIKGKKGWQTEPAWVFLDKIEESFANLKDGKDVAKECVDIANFCMFIWNKAKKA